MAKKKSRDKETPERLGADGPVEVQLASSGDTGAPATTQLTKKEYKQDMAGLQLSMSKMQGWVVGERLRVVVILEGLGPSGKIGTAHRIAEGLQERTCKVVALDPPAERARGQWLFKRYVEHFPTAGKMVIFDGSWYHTEAVQRALGLCSAEEFAQFLLACAEFERTLVDSGVTLIKFWFTAGAEEQERRFRAHMTELGKRNPYLGKAPLPATHAEVRSVKEAILAATGSEGAPWHVVQADDKRIARLDCMRQLLGLVPAASQEAPKAKAATRK